VTQPHLSNRQINWDLFRHLITERLTLKIPPKTPENIEEAVKLFNDNVQWAGWTAPNPAALPSSGNAWKKNDNSARDGNSQEHLKTRDHSTELYGTSNNFSTGTEMIACKPSCRA
jgi:hypothetical protein